ncbi:MAG: small basic protein [Planctomycetia bacterium]|nr:small basic protein [Planctomycetia bacterium]
MTIDKSLRVKKGVSRSRNVLTRVERIEKLKSMDKWAEGESPFDLPKVRVNKIVLKKKKKAKEEGDAAAAPAKGAAKAAPAKK